MVLDNALLLWCTKTDKEKNKSQFELLIWTWVYLLLFSPTFHLHFFWISIVGVDSVLSNGELSNSEPTFYSQEYSLFFLFIWSALSFLWKWECISNKWYIVSCQEWASYSWTYWSAHSSVTQDGPTSTDSDRHRLWRLLMNCWKNHLKPEKKKKIIISVRFNMIASCHLWLWEIFVLEKRGFSWKSETKKTTARFYLCYLYLILINVIVSWQLFIRHFGSPDFTVPAVSSPGCSWNETPESQTAVWLYWNVLFKYHFILSEMIAASSDDPATWSERHEPHVHKHKRIVCVTSSLLIINND